MCSRKTFSSTLFWKSIEAGFRQLTHQGQSCRFLPTRIVIGSFALPGFKYTNTPLCFIFFSKPPLRSMLRQIVARTLKIPKSIGLDTIPAKALKLSADINGPSLTWVNYTNLQNLMIGKNVKTTAQSPYYPLLGLVKYLRELFLIRNINFSVILNSKYLEKYQSGFPPRNLTRTALIYRCVTHSMKIWIMVSWWCCFPWYP
jgi:hypothetical protein